MDHCLGCPASLSLSDVIWGNNFQDLSALAVAQALVVLGNCLQDSRRLWQI